MKALLLKLLAWLSGISQTVLNSVILPILQGSVAPALEKLLPVAMTIVTELATSALSGEDKRKEAATQLKEAAVQAGVEASASAINLIVEMAVTRLKEAQG